MYSAATFYHGILVNSVFKLWLFIVIAIPRANPGTGCHDPLYQQLVNNNLKCIHRPFIQYRRIERIVYWGGGGKIVHVIGGCSYSLID